MSTSRVDHAAAGCPLARTDDLTHPPHGCRGLNVVIQRLSEAARGYHVSLGLALSAAVPGSRSGVIRACHSYRALIDFFYGSSSATDEELPLYREQHNNLQAVFAPSYEGAQTTKHTFFDSSSNLVRRSMPPVPQHSSDLAAAAASAESIGPLPRA